MKKICIVTATRAEYGLQLPLIRRISSDSDLALQLIVTGTHLSEKYGSTISEIKKDDVPIAYELPVLDDDNTPYGISLTMSNALRKFSRIFHDDRPDLLVVYGDRTEMLAVASAAVNERIPIAHICGGEVTEGAVDDVVRHALTKLGFLHFTETEVYRRRVIQMGEHPDRVFNTGSFAVEIINNLPLLTSEEVTARYHIPSDMTYAVVTLHPETQEDVNCAKKNAEQLCSAMHTKNNIFYLITGSNADAGGDEINDMLKEFAQDHDNTGFFDSLGTMGYLSALKHASFVLGNSSSGITEAPILGVPTVNVGDRQKGRLRTGTIIDCRCDCDDITCAIHSAEKMKHKPDNIYGDGKTSENIYRIMKHWVYSNKNDDRKHFYDITF